MRCPRSRSVEPVSLQPPSQVKKIGCFGGWRREPHRQGMLQARDDVMVCR